MNEQGQKLDVYLTNRSALVDYAAPIVGCRAQAEEVVQEAWLRFNQAEEGNLRQPLAYLYRIVHNLAMDLTRRAVHQPQPLEDAPCSPNCPPARPPPNSSSSSRTSCASSPKPWNGCPCAHAPLSRCTAWAASPYNRWPHIWAFQLDWHTSWCAQHSATAWPAWRTSRPDDPIARSTPVRAYAHDDQRPSPARYPHGEEALDWLLGLQERPDDVMLQAACQACQAWQAAAPKHARAWRRAERLWRLSGQLQPGTRAAWPDVPQPTRRRRPARRALYGIGSALAASLLLALMPTNLPWRPDLSNPPGPARQIALEDDSTLWLRGDTAVDLNFGAEVRQGGIFLEISPDRLRPFVVQAGDSRVVVTGTAFSVDLEERHLAVAVEHGSVQVETLRDSKELEAGERLDLDRESSLAQIGRQPSGQVAAWRRNQLIADDQRVVDLLDALHNQSSQWVLLRDPQLAELRVTGLYELGDPQVTLQAMVKPHGGRVERWSPWQLVVSRHRFFSCFSENSPHSFVSASRNR